MLTYVLLAGVGFYFYNQWKQQQVKSNNPRLK